MLLVAAAAAFAAAASGCGAVGHISHPGNAAVGKKLFTQTCGACHTLAAAGTTGTIGPDLDSAFGSDKCQGFHISTIRDIVRGQIAYAESNTGTTHQGMPDDLYRGQDAIDVATYVAMAAQLPATERTQIQCAPVTGG